MPLASLADHATVTGIVLFAKLVASILIAPALIVMFGAVATGAAVSMVTLRPAEAGLSVPTASAAWAVIAWLPSASRLVLTEYVPMLLVAALPTLTPSDRMPTVVPAGAVPVNVGVLMLVMLSPFTPESLAGSSTGFDGAPTGCAAPLPLSATVCGLPVALSAKLSVPLAAPVAVGLKTTFTVHEPPAATVTQLLLVIAKGPETVTLVTDSDALPVLFSVTDFAALVEPTTWPAKVRLAGLRL